MKLNDPFGRMARRQQTGYESVRDMMHNAGIDTPQAAREIIRKTKIRALKFIGMSLAVLLLVKLFLPNALLGTFAVVLLVVVWVLIWTVNGERFIKRYIDEDLGVGNKSQEGN